MTGPSRGLVRLIAVLAVLELGSLAVLLTNLFTAHVPAITHAMGPTHGAIYLAVVVTMVFAPGFRAVDRLLGCVPVVGGTIAVVRALRR